MIQLLDLFVVALVYVGTYYKIKKNKIGWFISGSTVCYWFLRASSLGLYSQALGHVISLGIAVYAFYKWKKDEE